MERELFYSLGVYEGSVLKFVSINVNKDRVQFCTLVNTENGSSGSIWVPEQLLSSEERLFFVDKVSQLVSYCPYCTLHQILLGRSNQG
jgi:hypothetical protein